MLFLILPPFSCSIPSPAIHPHVPHPLSRVPTHPTSGVHPPITSSPISHPCSSINQLTPTTTRPPLHLPSILPQRLSIPSFFICAPSSFLSLLFDLCSHPPIHSLIHSTPTTERGPRLRSFHVCQKEKYLGIRKDLSASPQP